MKKTQVEINDYNSAAALIGDIIETHYIYDEIADHYDFLVNRLRAESVASEDAHRWVTRYISSRVNKNRQS